MYKSIVPRMARHLGEQGQDVQVIVRQLFCIDFQNVNEDLVILFTIADKNSLNKMAACHHNIPFTIYKRFSSQKGNQNVFSLSLVITCLLHI